MMPAGPLMLAMGTSTVWLSTCVAPLPASRGWLGSLTRTLTPYTKMLTVS